MIAGNSHDLNENEENLDNPSINDPKPDEDQDDPKPDEDQDDPIPDEDQDDP